MGLFKKIRKAIRGDVRGGPLGRMIGESMMPHMSMAANIPVGGVTRGRFMFGPVEQGNGRYAGGVPGVDGPTPQSVPLVTNIGPQAPKLPGVAPGATGAIGAPMVAGTPAPIGGPQAVGAVQPGMVPAGLSPVAASMVGSAIGNPMQMAASQPPPKKTIQPPPGGPAVYTA